MGNSINDGAGAPICSGDFDIAVQVTGLGHTSNTQHQKIKLQHFNGDRSSSGLLESESNEEINQQTIVPSTIFKWGDNGKTPNGQKTKIILEIATEKGAPIKIPVVDEFFPDGSTPTIDDYYLSNRLRAIEPFSYITTDIDGREYYAPCRIGYIYIFIDDKLWRELFVSRDEATGVNRYQDVNLANYRQNNNDGSYNYKKGERETTGKPLQDIWIPEEFYQSGSYVSPKIIFSDIQLSAERLDYLESNVDNLNKRADLIFWYVGNENRTGNIYYNGSVYPIKNLPASRAREETTEYLLDNRHTFLVSNGYLENALSNANHFRSTLQGRNAPPPDVRPISGGEETSAWHYVLLKSKTERTGEEEKTLQQLASLWEDLPTFTNVWHQSSRRGIFGILVNDANYHLTYSKYRIQLLVQLHQLLAKDAEKQEYYTLASFIEKQRSIIEQFQEGLDDDISAAGLLRYKAAINLLERQAVTAVLKYNQKHIHYILKQEKTSEFFADMMSNEDNETDLVGHYNHLVELLFLATLAEAKYDNLLPVTTEIQEADYANSPTKFVNDILTNKSNRYHQMLWPDICADVVDVPYVVAEPQDNKGDGIFNSSTWERIVREDLLATKQPTTLNGISAIMIYEQAKHLPLLDKSNMPYFKTIVSALFSIIEKLKAATEHARTVALQSGSNYRVASNRLKRAVDELYKKRNELARAEMSEKHAQRQLQAYQNNVTRAENALKKIEQQAIEALETADVIKANIPVKELQLVRIVSGGKLNNLHFRVVPKVPINGVVEGFRIIGMAGNGGVRSDNVRRKFELFEDDTLLADSTTKGRRREVKLLVLPENDPYIQLRQYQLDIDIPDLEAHLATNKAAVQLTEGQLISLTKARAAAETAVSSAAQNRTRGIAQQMQSGTLFRRKIERALFVRRIQSITARIQRTGVAPTLLLGFELINLKFMFDNYENVRRTRHWARAIAGVGVPTFDTIMAAVIVAEQIEAKLYHLANKPVATASLNRVLNANSKILIALKVPNVAAKLVPLGGLAILTIGISISDTIDSIIRGDSSGFGNAVLVLAGVAGLLGMFATSSSPILGFGPIGWLIWAIALTVVGVGLLLFFSDSDIEQWFKQGPFGGYNEYSGLKNEQTAFAALLNLMTQPQVELLKNDDQAEAKKELTTLIPDTEDYEIMRKIASANMCIKITSGLLDFTNHDVALNYEVRLYRCEQTDTLPLGEKQWTTSYSYTQQTATILHAETTPQGIELFVYSPPNTPLKKESHYGSKFNSQKNYYWVVAVQGQSTLGDSEQTYYFPAPSFKENKPYNSVTDANPTFKVPATKIQSLIDGPLDTDDLKQDYWFKYIASTKVFNP